MSFDDLNLNHIPEPGMLPSDPLPITNIKRISPSVFSVLKSCKLKGVWASNHIPPLLPLSPNLHIGNIVHKTLQLSNMGKIRDKKDFDETWALLIRQEEEKMRGNWLEQALVPLNKTCIDFEVKKKFIEKNVLGSSHNISDKNAPRLHLPNEEMKENGYNGQFEKWIESKDGIIGGYIDAIIPGMDGDTLIDYKTGKIFERDDTRAGIRDDYLFQLRLYAALYHQHNNRWPQKIEIRGLGDLIYEVDVDPKECTKALEDASSLFKITNALIMESNRGRSGDSDRLANPSPNNCRYCQYRPLCKSYWTAKQQQSEDGWPFDVTGEIIEKTMLKNGKTLLKITPPDSRAEPIFIKGVQPDRHPIIGTVGDFVMICSLRPERHSKNFQEGELTTFYLIS